MQCDTVKMKRSLKFAKYLTIVIKAARLLQMAQCGS